MFSAFGRILRHIVPSAGTGRSIFASEGEGGGKRSRWEGSCGSEHTVIYLLLQGGHLSAHGLATLSCVSRAFRSACENESLWHLAAVMQWPSLNSPDVDSSILSSGGYQRLYQLLFTQQVGDIQLSVPTNQAHSLIEDVSLFLDLSHKGVSVYSRRLDGKKDLPQLQQAEAVVFRPPDMEVGSVLVDGRPVLSRRALERCTREIHATCIGLRWRDNKFCLLLNGKLNSSGMIGGSVYGSIQSNYALPGIFQVMCLTVDVVVAVTSRVREVERRGEDDVVVVADGQPQQRAQDGVVGQPTPVLGIVFHVGTGAPAGAGTRVAGGERGRGDAAVADAGGAAVAAADSTAESGTGDTTTQTAQGGAGAGRGEVGGESVGGAAAGEGGGVGEGGRGVGGEMSAEGSRLRRGASGGDVASEARGGTAAEERGSRGERLSAVTAAVISAANAAGMTGVTHLGLGVVALTTAGAAGAPVRNGAALGTAPAAPLAAAGGVAVAAAGAGAGASAAAAGAGVAAAAGAGVAAAGAGVSAAAADATAPGAVAAGAANTDTLLDIILGDMSFQIKVSADQGEGRRNMKDPKWLDLKWK